MRYDRMRAIVSRRLDASGTNAALVWEEVTGGTGPMDPGEVTEVTAPVRVALTDYTLQERAGSSSIQEADRKAIVSAGEVAPDTSKLLRIDGHDWQIASVRTIGPDGSAILHEVQVR